MTTRKHQLDKFSSQLLRNGDWFSFNDFCMYPFRYLIPFEHHIRTENKLGKLSVNLIIYILTIMISNAAF